jgi:hypothetical protein
MDEDERWFAYVILFCVYVYVMGIATGYYLYEVMEIYDIGWPEPRPPPTTNTTFSNCVFLRLDDV